jgi:signal transduction histidine kinase
MIVLLGVRRARHDDQANDQRADKVSHPLMLGSFDEITEVFVNIIENAIKYGTANTQIESVFLRSVQTACKSM